MELSIFNFIAITLISIIAGMVNALAGGGSFFLLPLLLHLGVSPVTASATSASMLIAGYISSAFQYKVHIIKQKNIINRLFFTILLGSALGSFLLVQTGNYLFAKLIPFLLLLASCLFYFAQEWIKKISLVKSYAQHGFIFLTALYGGFFGAGMGVVIMALLLLIGIDNLQNNLAIKHIISTTIATVSMSLFAFNGFIEWYIFWIGMPSAYLGGVLGAKLSQKIANDGISKAVFVIGLLLSIYYFYQYWV